MNKLELAKRLSRECGINQTGPSSTTNQVGEYLRVVEWIDTAYQNIQTIHSTWEFLRNEFSFSLVSGTASYTPTAAGLTDFSEWVPDDFRLYLSASDEQYIEYIPWDDFRQIYMVGTQRTQTGRPSAFTIKPDDTLLFFPIPNDAFTCVGEYFRTPHEMTADAHEPIFAERFHMMIVWRAMMFYGQYSQEPDKYSAGQFEYRKMLRTLEKSQLPAITWGEPLA